MSNPPKTMMAMRFYAPEDIRYESLPLPEPAAGELRLRIGAALTCGTDLKCYRRGHPVLLGPPPSPFGHEFAGTIDAVGEGVSAWRVGQRVVAPNSAPCLSCFFCEKEQFNLCENLKLLNGAYAEYIILPKPIVDINTYEIPDDMPFEIAAFVEPLSVAIRAVHGIGIQAGDHVAVLGLGSIGQLIVKVATLAGAHVTGIARNAMKLDMANHFGAAVQTISIADDFDPHELVKTYSPEGRGWDAVIEAVGLPETWQKAVDLCRRGGKVHWFAGCKGGAHIPLDTKRIHYDEITLYSLFHHTPKEVKMSYDLLVSGAIDPRPLISQQVDLPDLESAFKGMMAGDVFKASVLI